MGATSNGTNGTGPKTLKDKYGAFNFDLHLTESATNALAKECQKLKKKRQEALPVISVGELPKSVRPVLIQKLVDVTNNMTPGLDMGTEVSGEMANSAMKTLFNWNPALPEYVTVHLDLPGMQGGAVGFKISSDELMRAFGANLKRPPR